MANMNIRYRLVNKDGNEISSDEGFMTVITKGGKLAMFDTKQNKLMFGIKLGNIEVEVATYKHNGHWVYEKPKKDTYSVWNKLKRLSSKIFKSDKGE